MADPDLRRMRALLKQKPRLYHRYPFLYPLAVGVHRARRRVQWLRSDALWATARQSQDLPVPIKGHDPVLLRQLGESEMYLQHNKVTNLRLAASRVDGVLIRPGEVFSFNRVVGNCTRRRGYLDGVRLSQGETVAGVGGGICQLANTIHWLVLHSPLTVTERSEHSVDPFPDDGRVVPWGVGCSIVYNYVDLQVRNDTEATFQLRFAVGDSHLGGRLLVEGDLPMSYEVYAADEHFYRYGDDFFRANELRRRVLKGSEGQCIGDEFIRSNCARVKYVPQGVDIQEISVGSQAS